MAMEPVLSQLNKDILLLDKRVQQLKDKYESAEREYREAMEDLSSALKYRNYKAHQLGGSAGTDKVLNANGEMIISISTKARKSPVQDAVFATLQKSNQALRFRDILEGVRKTNKELNNIGPNNLYLAITKMMKKKLIERVETGFYAIVIRK